MLFKSFRQLLAKSILDIGKNYGQLLAAIVLHQCIDGLIQLRKQLEKRLIAKCLAINQRTVQIKDYTKTTHLRCFLGLNLLYALLFENIRWNNKVGATRLASQPPLANFYIRAPNQAVTKPFHAHFVSRFQPFAPQSCRVRWRDADRSRALRLQ